MARAGAVGRRKLWAVGFVGAILSAIAPAGAAAADGCGGPVRVETLHVHVTATRAVVRAGRPAALEVSVARAVAHHDLAPVQDAHVLVFAEVGRTEIGAMGTTGAEGLAPISLTVPKRSAVGEADVTVVATQQPVHCVEEYGETLHKGLFKVRK